MTAPRSGKDARPRLVDFWHDLPREGRLLLSIVVLQFLGTGLVLPFHIVYLAEVRGFGYSTAGLLIAVQPLVGLVAAAPGGHAIDRLGPRRVLAAALACLVVGGVVLALASSLPVAVAGLALQGLAFGLEWPAAQSLVAAVVPPAIRQRYFGLNFALLNLGIGLGGIVGGLFVDVDRVITFQTIYLADAASYLPALVLLLGPLRHVGGPVTHAPEPGGETGAGAEAATASVSYWAVLRRPAVASVMGLGFLASFVGYSQLNAGLQAFAREVGEVSTRGLGLAFAANTAVIVVLQLLVLQRIEGRRRTRVMAVMAVVWAGSWLLLGATALVPGTVGATLLVAGCASVFALGETLMQPTLPALVNDLAPDALRGRYNALSSISFQSAAIIAPPIAGFLVGHGLGQTYIGLLVMGSLVLGVVAVVHLEKRLSPAVNGVREPEVPGAETLPAGGVV
ncbi:MFS transporter [Nocardioides sp. GY 10127]|uniref:MFS transporter n=1 Tax=Nocardioides sp. GY 10127 TaxID=2569762 RepID=UPI0010A85609|nr:MFS transporter [Nocardioides sp. GY 10127]TIC81945.1 MFS transporter [Nocardioides sp. GY 10127]